MGVPTRSADAPRALAFPTNPHWSRDREVLPLKAEVHDGGLNAGQRREVGDLVLRDEVHQRQSGFRGRAAKVR